MRTQLNELEDRLVLSVAEVRNRVPSLRCFKIVAPILLFRRGIRHIYSLKIQNTLLVERKNQKGFKKLEFTSFPRKK